MWCFEENMVDIGCWAAKLEKRTAVTFMMKPGVLESSLLCASFVNFKTKSALAILSHK
jgi:hypothetical protein